MKCTLLFLILIGTILAKASDVNNQSLHRVKRIVNGCEPTPHSIPYQVGLKMFTLLHRLKQFIEDSNYIHCGGVLISQKFVLTAAHCTKGALIVDVYLGVHEFNRVDGSYILRSYKIYDHEDYNKKTLENDIALIKLPKPVQLSKRISVVSLPSIVYGFFPRHKSYVNEIATISGWGFVNDTHKQPSKDLRYAKTIIIDNKKCSRYKKYYDKAVVRDTNICTDGKYCKGSTCNGDSGGPLVVDGVLVGIVSFGDQRGCEYKTPSVYTRITSYLSWIEDHSDVEIKYNIDYNIDYDYDDRIYWQLLCKGCSCGGDC